MEDRHNNLTFDESVRVWVCPTDTVYGLSARYNDREAVERIKQIKTGREDRPFIVLISEFEQLSALGIALSAQQKEFLTKIWPGPVTVVFNRGDNETMAVRLPDYAPLRELINKIGPVISTSANRHGKPPVTSIDEAKEIFGGEVDAYFDGGELRAEPSVIVKLLR